MSFCPGDYDIEYFITPPNSAQRFVIGVQSGNFCLPALRFEELLLLATNIRSADLVSRARAFLLFYPLVSTDTCQELEAKRLLREAWSNFGWSVNHMDEWIDRISPGYEAIWTLHPQHGWLYAEDSHSLRTQRGAKHQRTSPEMLIAVRKLFSSLK